MTSSAISAQNSVLSIGTGSGSAKTISGIILGNPTIITSAAHGLGIGDVVTIAGVVGTTTVNGQWGIVYKTANTFAIELDTTGGTTWASGGTATSVTFTPIVNMHDFTGFDGSASEIDVTNMSSTAKEYRLGLTDPGQFSINIDYDNTNVGHNALRSKQVSGAVTNFQLVLPNAAVMSFVGFVKKFSLAGGVDAVVKTAVDIRISGAVTGL